MKVAVTWQMCGYVDVDAATMEDAINEIVKNGDHYKLPSDGVYVDGSFEPSTYDAEEQEAMMKSKKNDLSDIERKKTYVISQIGDDICTDMTDTFFEHTYRAMKDYDMSVYDADKWAWLNTLFGYDIGADRALNLITWYDDNGMDVLDLGADDRETLRNVAEMELGLHFNFAAFVGETPTAISYSWPDHI